MLNLIFNYSIIHVQNKNASMSQINVIQQQCTVNFWANRGIESQLGLRTDKNTHLSLSVHTCISWPSIRSYAWLWAIGIFNGHQSSILPYSCESFFCQVRARASQCTAARAVSFQRLFLIVQLFWGGASQIVSNSAAPRDSTNNYALYCETTCTSPVYASALGSIQRPNWHIGAQSYMDRQGYRNIFAHNWKCKNVLTRDVCPIIRLDCENWRRQLIGNVCHTRLYFSFVYSSVAYKLA